MSEKQMELRSSMENKLINHVEMSCEWEVGKCYIIVSTVTGVGMDGVNECAKVSYSRFCFEDLKYRNLWHRLPRGKAHVLHE